MFIISYADIIATQAFNNDLKVKHFDLIQALTRTHEYTVAQEQRVDTRVTDKANGNCNPLERSNVNLKTDKSFCELGINTFAEDSRHFRHSQYKNRDQRV